MAWRVQEMRQHKICEASITCRWPWVRESPCTNQQWQETLIVATTSSPHPVCHMGLILPAGPQTLVTPCQGDRWESWGDRDADCRPKDCSSDTFCGGFAGPWIRFKRGRAAVPISSVPIVSQGDLAFTQIMHLGEIYAVSRKAREWTPALMNNSIQSLPPLTDTILSCTLWLRCHLTCSFL